ncbi:MAG: 5-methyltetrahydropteroyltriglutamate--homocysteine S-methyltransferase [Candidatus Obscuribacterales bacterium]|nr:5-methyltetrahydropteroyltriglutamate--homocysteine S-methyltransferase [Candidatus Obscuribacterales bacterium]
MVLACNLGFPRIGPRRELKKALESYWAGKISQEELLLVGKQIREQNWLFQKESGLDHIPSNDFSFYDHVLDTACMVGALPKRFGSCPDNIDLDTYFLMARGATTPASKKNKSDAHPLEMTKWFNTNYHYIVPELEPEQEFKLSSRKCLDEFIEAKKLGIITRPVLLGPVSFLLLAKSKVQVSDQLLAVYKQVLTQLKEAGCAWVQMDEPCLSLSLDSQTQAALQKSYATLVGSDAPEILLASYFGRLADNLQTVLKLPVSALHIDLSCGLDELDSLLTQLPASMKLSVGIVDGRNIWKANLLEKVELLEKIAEKIGLEKLMVAPSCSLIHVPVDAGAEKRMAPEILSWLSFAKQKVRETALLVDALCCGKKAIAEELAAHQASVSARRTSLLTNNPEVKKRLAAVNENMYRRASEYSIRKKKQVEKWKLPLLPTTTIGSFPQTAQLRQARKDLRAGILTDEEYGSRIRQEITSNIARQEELELDVLVHGEPERNDMVEFFADKLAGMAVSEHGWVQSYGSRYVKPPIIFGDVYRLEPMTVELAIYAQEQSKKPVKGMLTGPVTILQWSFVRDDQPREITCRQLALAIRDEVEELQFNGIGVIQIDEPAIREGLPLHKTGWAEYLSWSVGCFKLSAAVALDETQIHTHMCYSEFNDMVESIAAMDADVISIEAARSQMDLLDSIRERVYPNDIGPGVYDIHSPLIPKQEEMERLIQKASTVIAVDKLWINPDCGLKTRKWEEVTPALAAMVAAAKKLRQEMIVRK